MDDPGDLAAEPGSKPWALAMRLQLLTSFKERDSAANHLQVMRDGFKKLEGWRLLVDRRGRPFESWEAFCKAPTPFGLGTTAEHIDDEVTRRAMLTMQMAPKMVGQGTRTDLQHVDDIHKLPKGSTSAPRLAARLKRDHPEIAARVAAGEIRSIRAAAILAGILKERTPLQHLWLWWKKASVIERRQFRKQIRERK